MQKILKKYFYFLLLLISSIQTLLGRFALHFFLDRFMTRTKYSIKIILDKNLLGLTSESWALNCSKHFINFITSTTVKNTSWNSTEALAANKLKLPSIRLGRTTQFSPTIQGRATLHFSKQFPVLYLHRWAIQLIYSVWIREI